MAKKSLKKGPHRMATSCKPETALEAKDREISSRIKDFAERVNSVIQEARANMTDSEREEADRKAKVIFDRASDAAKSSRHTA